MGTALIIEDDPDASLLLASLLEDRGYETFAAETGEMGLKIARQAEPDVIFLDLMLPDLDGYKICEALKLDRETNPIPIVMVTALSAAANRVRGFRVGADAYVTKPYTPEDIDEAILRTADRARRLGEDHLDLLVHFDLESQIANLESVNELFGILLRHARMSDAEVSQLRTALLEMGQNAIEWGNRHDPAKLVRIIAHVGHDAVRIEIVDEGEGFDPHNVPHAAVGGDDPTRHVAVREMLGLRDGGFGILIAKGLVDEVSYNQAGNAVTLLKRLSASNGHGG